MTTVSLSENETRAIWGMTGTSKYPMHFMNLLMDNMLGKIPGKKSHEPEVYCKQSPIFY